MFFFPVFSIEIMRNEKKKNKLIYPVRSGDISQRVSVALLFFYCHEPTKLMDIFIDDTTKKKQTNKRTNEVKSTR